MTQSLGVNTLENYVPDELFAGNHPSVEKPIIVISGTGKLTRGTVLGKIAYAVGDISATGNTGDTTIASATLSTNVKLGDYSIKCTTAPTEASANNAIFAVYAPDGTRLADATQGVAYAGGQLIFTIGNATETDCVVGDTFTINVENGSGKYKAYSSSNVDGSAVAEAILQRNIDATSADVKCSAFVHGEFNEAVLTGIDATAKAKLQELGIFVKKLY